MNQRLLACVVVGGLFTGCAKKRIAECDELVATALKVAKCEKLSAESRKPAEDAAKVIQDSLKTLDDAGGVGKAPKDLVDQMRHLCKTENTTFVDEHMKLAPECME